MCSAGITTSDLGTNKNKRRPQRQVVCCRKALTSTTPRLYMSAAKVHGSLFPSRSSGAE